MKLFSLFDVLDGLSSRNVLSANPFTAVYISCNMSFELTIFYNLVIEL